MEYIHRETPEKYRYVSQPKTRRNMMINHIESYEKNIDIFYGESSETYGDTAW